MRAIMMSLPLIRFFYQTSYQLKPSPFRNNDNNNDVSNICQSTFCILGAVLSVITSIISFNPHNNLCYLFQCNESMRQYL